MKNEKTMWVINNEMSLFLVPIASNTMHLQVILIIKTATDWLFNISKSSFPCKLQTFQNRFASQIFPDSKLAPKIRSVGWNNCPWNVEFFGWYHFPGYFIGGSSESPQCLLLAFYSKILGGDGDLWIIVLLEKERSFSGANNVRWCEVVGRFKRFSPVSWR